MIGYIVGTHYHYDYTHFDEPVPLIMDRGDAEAAARALDGSGRSGEVIEIQLPEGDE
jgi:hypothetical protein